jgi:REP element-mobilizing transposase RayT
VVLRGLDEARTEFAFQLWAYVVMPEHVHVLVYPGDSPERMSVFLQALKEPVARKAIRYLKSNAPEWLARVTVREGSRLRHRFWQPGGGYDRNITSTEALRAMIDYIHANPVRRGLVARAEDWQMVQRPLVRRAAAGEAGNGPGCAGGAGTGMRWLPLPARPSEYLRACHPTMYAACKGSTPRAW